MDPWEEAAAVGSSAAPGVSRPSLMRGSGGSASVDGRGDGPGFGPGPGGNVGGRGQGGGRRQATLDLDRMASPPRPGALLL